MGFLIDLLNLYLPSVGFAIHTKGSRDTTTQQKVQQTPPSQLHYTAFALVSPYISNWRAKLCETLFAQGFASRKNIVIIFICF